MLFCSCNFSPFSIAITSLGEERANLGAFRAFVRFPLVWFCLFSLSLRVWDGLRLVIVALPGFSSYLLDMDIEDTDQTVRKRILTCIFTGCTCPKIYVQPLWLLQQSPML